MKARAFVDEEKLVTQAIEALIEKLGPVEASRFLTLPQKKRKESVLRHRQWQSGLDKDEFFNRVFS